MKIVKLNLKRAAVLLFGGLLVALFSVLCYCAYKYIFYSQDIALTAWAVTLGVFNALLSPAKFLAMFRL